MLVTVFKGVGVRVGVEERVEVSDGVEVIVRVWVDDGVPVELGVGEKLEVLVEEGVDVSVGVKVRVGVRVGVEVAVTPHPIRADRTGYHLSEIFWLPEAFGWTPSNVSVAVLYPVHWSTTVMGDWAVVLVSAQFCTTALKSMTL